MKERIRNILTTMVRPMNLDRLITWSGQDSFFPFYHTVSPEALPHVSHLYRVLKPAAFEKDLEQLLLRFEPVSLGDYLENRGGKKGKRRMVLTFDDGLKECYDIIAPMLIKKGIPATFFLNNRFIDNRGLFYRYKASLLVHQVRDDCRANEKVADYLNIDKELVEASIKMIAWDQRALLDVLAGVAELDYASYLRTRPVYLSSGEIEKLLYWGFELGGHSSDHMDFSGLDPDQMVKQVKSSIRDLQKRFGIHTAYFSFPFTSDGVPRKVVDTLLDQGSVKALLGTAGLKRTGKHAYIQRVPMEQYKTPALETLKTEYLYYLLKMPLGRNRLRQ
jgi:peptidoglycan/xylan/chitin deacetylase (PgdA/CDA1 family)